MASFISRLQGCVFVISPSASSLSCRRRSTLRPWQYRTAGVIWGIVRQWDGEKDLPHRIGFWSPLPQFLKSKTWGPFFRCRFLRCVVRWSSLGRAVRRDPQILPRGHCRYRGTYLQGKILRCFVCFSKALNWM